MDDEDDPLTAAELYEELRSLDSTLRETRRRANDREVQYQALAQVSVLAELTLPTGLGGSLDQALLKPKAASILLVRALRRAQKNVPTLPQDIDALSAAIDRLLDLLPSTRRELEWLMGLTRDELPPSA